MTKRDSKKRISSLLTIFIIALAALVAPNCTTVNMDFFDVTVDKGVTVTVVNTDTTEPTFAGIDSVTVISSYEIKLAWLDATDDVSASADITYKVCYATSSNTCDTSFPVYATTDKGVLTKTYRIFQPNTTYYFVVRAVDEAGNLDTNTTQLSVTTPVANSWTTLTDMPTARFDFATVVYGGLIFTIGGNDGTADLDVVEVYIPQADTWTTVAVLPSPASKLSACEVVGSLFVFTGGVVYQYDAGNDAWIDKATPGITSRDYASCEVVGTNIYLLGGDIAGTDQNLVEEYDQALNVMSNCGATCTTLTTALSAPPTAVYNSLIYVLGGDSGGATTAGEYFTAGDPGTWTAVTASPYAIAGATAEAINHHIYVIGGNAVTPLSGMVLQFDALSDSWKVLGSQIYPTTNHGSAVIDNKIYIIGGKDNSGAAVSYLQLYQ